MEIMRGADLLAQTLAQAGTKVIFSLSGNQIMPIYDACIDTKIRIIHVRHEAAAVFMADAHAQLTGRPGVALVTAAPGFGNAVAPLFTARESESPVLLLSGDSPRAQDGTGAFQELDQVSVTAPLTKLSFRPDRAAGLGTDIARALKVASGGRPGPVHCALPFDLLNEDVGNVTLPGEEQFKPEKETPLAETISTIADTLAGAQRPVILTGPCLNASRAGNLIAALADVMDAPVIPMESPRGLNDPSLGALRSVLGKADVILSLGKKLDFTTGFAKPPAVASDCKLLLIEPEAEELARAKAAAGTRLIAAYQADPALTAQTLIDAVQESEARAAYREEVAAALAERPAVADGGPATPMHPARLCAAVQDLLDAADDPVLIMDGGEFGQWAQACLSTKTRIINGPGGSIGGTLSYALAAKVARPESPVVVLMGDGTAGFHFAEFETAHRYGLEFIAIIGNDARWNAEYQIQLREYGENRTYECELNPTRYDLAAAGLGCHGEHVDDPNELNGALVRAQKSGLPACINVTISGPAAPAGH